MLTGQSQHVLQKLKLKDRSWFLSGVRRVCWKEGTTVPDLESWTLGLQQGGLLYFHSASNLQITNLPCSNLRGKDVILSSFYSLLFLLKWVRWVLLCIGQNWQFSGSIDLWTNSWRVQRELNAWSWTLRSWEPERVHYWGKARLPISTNPASLRGTNPASLLLLCLLPTSSHFSSSFSGHLPTKALVLKPIADDEKNAVMISEASAANSTSPLTTSSMWQKSTFTVVARSFADGQNVLSFSNLYL